VDFCSFGNSTPFASASSTRFNDNPTISHIKKADASRIYGLELEHLLSPNRLNFITHGNTLVEEHIAGVPGDIFSARWLDNRELKPIRIAKELVKFNERCFVACWATCAATICRRAHADFEGWQVRIRANGFRPAVAPRAEKLLPAAFFKEKASSRSSAPSTPPADGASIPARGTDHDACARRDHRPASQRPARSDGKGSHRPEENVQTLAGGSCSTSLPPLLALRQHGCVGAREHRDAPPLPKRGARFAGAV